MRSTICHFHFKKEKEINQKDSMFTLQKMR